MTALLNPFWFAAGATDPLFAQVVLLCHFDGANGASGTSIIDSSSHAHSFSGATTQLTTSQQKFGTASLNAGSGVCTTGDSADWHFGAGQFTIEAFVRPTVAISGVRVIVGQFQASTNLGWDFYFNGNNLVFAYSTTGTNNLGPTVAYTPTLNTWVHVAVDRDASNLIRLYADGVVLTSLSGAGTLFDSTLVLTLGNDGVGTRFFNGQIDELRITKGTARYAGAFTPPTAAFPNS